MLIKTLKTEREVHKPCQIMKSTHHMALVRGSPTDCGTSSCVIKKPRKRGG